MLNEKNLPNYFWAEAVATTVYIMNQTPTATVHGMTPEEKFTGKTCFTPQSVWLHCICACS
jgi:hypothetical protein